MKLGVFDSGVGGFLMTKFIREKLPEIDLLYYGDTLNLPYGNHSEDIIRKYTENAMRYMFEHGCAVNVIACNTATAAAYRHLKEKFLPEEYPDRDIIGVIDPTVEAIAKLGYKKIGVIATNYTVKSNIYGKKIHEANPDIVVEQISTPLLVPLIENDGMEWTEDVLRKKYLPILAERQVDSLLLGCTHYPMLIPAIQNIWGEDFPLISQNDIMPDFLKHYFKNNPEQSDRIAKNGQSDFYVSDLTEFYETAGCRIYGHKIDMQQAKK